MKKLILLLFIPLVSFSQIPQFPDNTDLFMMDGKIYEESISKYGFGDDVSLRFLKNEVDVFVLIRHYHTDADRDSLINGTLYLGLENGDVVSFEKPFYSEYVNDKAYRASYILTKTELDILKKYDIIFSNYSIHYKSANWFSNSDQIKKVSVYYGMYRDINSMNYNSRYILNEFLKWKSKIGPFDLFL